jgi:lipopolysaccharide transport system permease protein
VTNQEAAVESAANGGITTKPPLIAASGPSQPGATAPPQPDDATEVSTAKADSYELVIEPGRTELHYWRDLWRSRQLFYMLAWRDLAVRYKQTVIGVAWAVVQPLLTTIVMTLVFGMVAKLPTDGNAPYAILVLAAMLPWQFVSTALSVASQSLVMNANLISKVYFPRMIIPASTVITSFVDLLIGFVILAGMMAWFRFCPDWRILTLPLFMAIAFLAAMGPGLLVTALTVKYRDFRYVIPFLVQFGLYVSPVGYSSSVIQTRFGDKVYFLYSLNPMVGVIDGFRWALLRGEAPIFWPGFVLSLVISTLFLVIGVRYFRKTERSFADVI